MNTNKKIMSMGIILLISGILAAFFSFEPSRILQYIFVLTSFVVGIIGIIIGKSTKGTFVRSSYYTWIGSVLIGLSIALVIWATTLMAFVNVLGFFLLILGIIEFVFVLQIFNYVSPIPWVVVAIKLALSTIGAVGAAWILTMAQIDVYTALLFLGVQFVLIGLSLILISRQAKSQIHQSLINQ